MTRLDRRLRWRCRRGVREMDLLLDRFLAAAGGPLDEDTRQALERLLDRPDRDVLDWIARRRPPPDAALAALVDRIRSASAASPDEEGLPRAS